MTAEFSVSFKRRSGPEGPHSGVGAVALVSASTCCTQRVSTACISSPLPLRKLRRVTDRCTGHNKICTGCSPCAGAGAREEIPCDAAGGGMER